MKGKEDRQQSLELQRPRDTGTSGRGTSAHQGWEEPSCPGNVKKLGVDSRQEWQRGNRELRQAGRGRILGALGLVLFLNDNGKPLRVFSRGTAWSDIQFANDLDQDEK